MNLPNKLTILRIALTFIFMIFLYTHGVAAKVFALLIFLAASLTDALDGYIAKKNNQITDFGRIMDPIADKILVLAALLAFVEKGLVPAWMIVIIIFREAAVTALRLFALAKSKVIQADTGGKKKTILQISAIVTILIFIILKEGGAARFGFWSAGVEALYRDAIFVIMLVTVILTVKSGLAYFIKNAEVYSNEKKN